MWRKFGCAIYCRTGTTGRLKLEQLVAQFVVTIRSSLLEKPVVAFGNFQLARRQHLECLYY